MAQLMIIGERPVGMSMSECGDTTSGAVEDVRDRVRRCASRASSLVAGLKCIVAGEAHATRRHGCETLTNTKPRTRVILQRL